MVASDHAPLFLQLCPEVNGNSKRRPFRFEAAWLNHESFKDLLVNSWNTGTSTPKALDELRIKLKQWNRDVFGDVQKRKDKLLEDITQVQDLLDVGQSDDLLSKESDLLRELDVVLAQEELLWFQKSREKWIAMGDRNTKYFHTSTIIRRRRNRIDMLKDNAGLWVSNTQELETLAVSYYNRLYSMMDVEQTVEKLQSVGFPGLTEQEIARLNRPFAEQDVKEAVWCMGKYKAPGPDGYQPVFYQHCWEVVGPSVIKLVLDFFATGCLPVGTNNALVVLIAKVAKPETIMQFRPISLCNVLFKIITKTLVMRLKGLMPKLIGPAQASFIPGRLSTDNIVVVQEAVKEEREKRVDASEVGSRESI